MTDMYRCNDCGKIFHASEFKAIQEYRGECWGTPAYETMYYCPSCEGSDYDEYVEEEEEEC